jgi:HlyD family secretion protein
VIKPMLRGRLLLAGSRPEDIRQAESQLEASRADQAASEAELASAQIDLDRFEMLLASSSGSRKQRDDAAARRDVARERTRAARDRASGAAEALARVKSGARREEIAAAEARVAAADAQIRILEKAVADATVSAPVAGTVTDVIADAGELVGPGAPLVIVTDLAHAWANVYVDEPIVPRLRLGQAVTLFTDDGGEGIPGTISYISPKAEFTPRNVQTSEDRAQLVYRLKISSTQQQAMMTTTFLFFMPMVYLSGFIFPIENMPAAIQPITYLIPLRYFLVILRAIFLKGVGLETFLPEAAALVAWGIAILGLALARSSKRTA